MVSDGHLLGETPAEVNLAELLHIAQREFKSVKAIDELELEKDWPRLRAALGKALLNWNRRLNVVSPKPASTPVLHVNGLPLWRQRFLHIKNGLR